LGAPIDSTGLAGVTMPSSVDDARRLARRSLLIAAMFGVAAVVVLSVASTLGDVHGHTLEEKLIAFLGAAVFLVLSVVAIRSCGTGLSLLVAHGSAASTSAAVKIVVGIAGYTVVLFGCLGLVAVPVQRLLVGGAVAGVVLGIAAQQTLGNVFAGILLLLARPFTLGETVRVRSGSLGGIFEGTVTAMNLVYVTIETDEGIINVPNAGLLAAGVGPAPVTSPRDVVPGA
jgi:small-conductance mechanosensitive channel